jgi:hypothetical protein
MDHWVKPGGDDLTDIAVILRCALFGRASKDAI